MTAFVYIVQCVGVPLYKIGHTGQPKERMALLQGASPFPLHFHRVLEVESKSHAIAFEKHAHSWLAPVSSHAEWYNDLDAVNAQFDCIAPAVDVTDQYGITTKRAPHSRAPQSLAKLAKDLADADRRVAVYAKHWPSAPNAMLGFLPEVAA